MPSMWPQNTRKKGLGDQRWSVIWPVTSLWKVTKTTIQTWWISSRCCSREGGLDHALRRRVLHVMMNKVYSIKIQSISGTASVNFGNTINIGNDSNSKSVGGSSYIGDMGRNMDFEQNRVYDPDQIDQP